MYLKKIQVGSPNTRTAGNSSGSLHKFTVTLYSLQITVYSLQFTVYSLFTEDAEEPEELA